VQISARQIRLEKASMVWLFIEMAVGFALFVLLVWWTWPKKK